MIICTVPYVMVKLILDFYVGHLSPRKSTMNWAHYPPSFDMFISATLSCLAIAHLCFRHTGGIFYFLPYFTIFSTVNYKLDFLPVKNRIFYR